MRLEREIIRASTRTGWKEILVYFPAFIIMMVGSAIGFFCGALGVAYGTRLFWGHIVDSVYFSLATVISGGIIGGTFTGLALSLVSFSLTDILASRLNKRTP
jgi:hypothetical protein